MPMRTLLSSTTLALLVAIATPREAHAQHEGHAGMAMETGADSMAPHKWHVMAQAIPVLTHAEHTAGGAGRTEVRLAQVALMGRANFLAGHLHFDGTLNGEGLTMRHGELSTGAFG